MQQLEDQATSWVGEVVEKVTAVSAAVQAELEEALKPLEASLANCGPVDTERERTYAVNSFNCGNNKVVHDILSVS